MLQAEYERVLTSPVEEAGVDEDHSILRLRNAIPTTSERQIDRVSHLLHTPYASPDSVSARLVQVCLRRDALWTH